MQLARLPNAFTSPTNVVAGYLMVTPVSDLNYASLAILMISSAFFYVSGIIFNDYFDIELDKKERPSRPLPSGAVSKKRAGQIALWLMGSAMIFAFFVSWSSFAVAIFLSGIILAYNYRLKHNKTLGPITMGGTRFLNVIFGASPTIQLAFPTNFWQLIFVASCVFVYVVVISLFSSKEISGIKSRQRVIVLFSINYIVITAIAIATFLGLFKPWSFVILAPFTVVMSIIFRQALLGDALVVQRAIKNMIISIIILDCVFVSGAAGLLYGLPMLTFLLPSIFLSRKFYVT